MHPYNSIGIIVVSPDFILFWFYYSVKLSLGWAAVTWRIERQWPKHGSVLSSMNPWRQMKKLLQKANQRVTQMPERLSGAYYLITRFLVHFTGSKGALYLVFSSLLCQATFGWRTCLLLGCWDLLERSSSQLEPMEWLKILPGNSHEHVINPLPLFQSATKQTHLPWEGSSAFSLPHFCLPHPKDLCSCLSCGDWT